MNLSSNFINWDNQGREIIVLKNIVHMAHDLGLSIVAEGVETQAYVDILKESGCNYGRGFFFSKPMPIHEFERLTL